MKAIWELIWFPFNDERWKHKMLIGMAVAFGSFLFFPLVWLLSGYGIGVMRSAIKRGEPSLPEWDDWGSLFGDGLKAMVVSLGYLSPMIILYCCAYAVITLALPTSMIFIEDVPEIAVGSIVLSYGLMFFAYAVIIMISIPLGYLSQVALTRMVALGNLSDAFQVGEVWRLGKRGYKSYIVALLLWYMTTAVFSSVATISIYTIILACLSPFLLSGAMVYSSVLNGALLGISYRETEGGVGPAEVAGEVV